MEQIIKTNKRNSNGVKSSCDMYRTINGCHYVHWSVMQTKEECQKEFPNEVFAVRNGEVYKKVNQ